MKIIGKSLIIRTTTNSFNNTFNIPSELPHEFENSLYLASSSLYKTLLKESKPSEKKRLRLNSTLYKYWQRSCSRPTPFGTFSGVFILPISEGKTEVVLDQTKNHKKRITLDSEVLNILINKILSINSIKTNVKYFPNNTLYKLNDSYRYIEEILINDKKPYYNLSQVESNKYLTKILNITKTGSTINNIIKYLSEFDSTISSENYTDFINSLIVNKILISELDIPLTCETDGIDYLINRLRTYNINQFQDIFNAIVKIRDLTKENINILRISESIHEILINIFKITNLSKDILHVNLHMSTIKSSFNQKLLNNILEDLQPIVFCTKRSTSPNIDIFISDFKKKYGENIYRSLPHVLDVDYGIGYANFALNFSSENEWLADIPSVVNFQENYENFSAVSNLLLDKYVDFIKENKKTIDITNQDLLKLKGSHNEKLLPKSLYSFGSLINYNSEDPGEFTFLLAGISGPSAANLFSRFSVGCQEITNTINNIVDHEEDNATDIFAEIVHSPNPRLRNVLARKPIRKNEIAYLSNSGCPNPNNININDINIGIEDSKIVLRHKKNKKRIVPRLTNAHFYKGDNLPLYQFLCDLQFQDIDQSIFWDWGPLEQLEFLPRIVYKNIIIRCARWRINFADFNNNLTIENIKQTLLQKKIPDLFQYKEIDNTIVFNKNENSSLIFFIELLKKRKIFDIEEFISVEKSLITDSDGNPFNNEIIIPFSPYDVNIYNNKSIKLDYNTKQIKHYQNSKWIYFNIYTSYKMIDNLLRKEIYDFVIKYNSKLFEKFFFIRYKDSKEHLRIRFFNSNELFNKELIHEFINILKKQIKNESIDNILLDTYIPELNRYGGEKLICFTEDIFFHDSLATLKFIHSEQLLDIENARLKYAFLSINSLLNDFKLSLKEKHTIIKEYADSYLNEFGNTKLLKKNLNNKYRRYNTFILQNFIEKEPIIDAILLERSKNIEFSILKIKNNKTKYTEIIKSHLHMLLNRLFMNDARKHELVIYNLMERHYYSQLILVKKSKNIKNG